MLRLQVNLVEVMSLWTVTASLWDADHTGSVVPVSHRSDSLGVTDEESFSDPLAAVLSALSRWTEHELQNHPSALL